MTFTDSLALPRPVANLPAKPQRGSRALRICFIQEPLHAGVGRHTVDVARELANRGHEIHVIYSPVRLEPQFLSDLSGHPRIHTHPIAMKPGLCPADARAFWQVQRYIRRNSPFDIIHGESSKGGGFARLLKLFGARKVLYSPHAFITLSPRLPFTKRWIFQSIEVLLSHLTDVIVCSSQNEREHAIAMGIAPHRLALVVNGRTPAPVRDRASLRTSLGFDDDKVVIGFAGRLETQKAPQRLIEAALRLLPKAPYLHLLVIGDGPERASLETRMREAGLQDRATWLGAVNAVEYMPAMDMLAMPSLYEGFAYVLIEALQAGLPLVATPVGGTHESILPSKNGIVVPHHPIEPLVAALRQLGLDADLRQRMAEAARARAAYFSVPRMVDGLESLYCQLCTTQPAGRAPAAAPSYLETPTGR